MRFCFLSIFDMTELCDSDLKKTQQLANFKFPNLKLSSHYRHHEQHILFRPFLGILLLDSIFFLTFFVHSFITLKFEIIISLYSSGRYVEKGPITLAHCAQCSTRGYFIKRGQINCFVVSAEINCLVWDHKTNSWCLSSFPGLLTMPNWATWKCEPL